MKHFITTIFTFLFLLVATASFAQSAKLSIQGVLRNANGSSVENGQYEITFRLWDAATGGTEIWFETISNVDVEGGIYSVVLGAGTTELNAAFDQPYFLGVTVESGTELIPRASLTSSPYALSLVGSDNVFPNSGNVGVGDASPSSKLTVKDGNGFIGIEPGTTANFTAKIQSTTEGLKFNNPTDKSFIFGNGATESVRIKNTNVGIGTDNPVKKLHVKGNGEVFRLEGQGNMLMELFQNGSSQRTGYFGYPWTNDPTMRLVNEQGALSITSTNFNVSSTGSSYINGPFEVRGNGGFLQLKGTDHVYLEFYPNSGQGRKAYFGFGGGGSPNLTIMNENGGGNIDIKSQQDLYISAGNSGRNIFLKGLISINGAKSESYNNYSYMVQPYNGFRWHEGGNVTKTYALKVNNAVKAPEFHAISDRRIKKDLKISNGKEDLATLKGIEVTDYKHIDEVSQGGNRVKGLIAQQLKSVFSEAVNVGKDFIPNVYDFPVSLKLENGEALFELSKLHDFKKGDVVKIIGEKEELFTVASIEDSNSFTIKDWKGSEQVEELFIYGKEVNDFHTVNYDRVFTLAVSATQELARKVEALEKENAKLRESNLKSENKNAALKADINELDHRIKTIEGLLNATGSK